MKNILITSLILAAALALTACGPKADIDPDNADGSISSADTPVGTAPADSGDDLFTPDATQPTAPDASTEPASEATTPATPESSETTPEATVTTPKESATDKPTSTTPKPTTTTEPTTTPAPATTPEPVTTPAEGEGETEDAGEEIIDNIDEFLASIGITEDGDFNTGD